MVKQRLKDKKGHAVEGIFIFIVMIIIFVFAFQTVNVLTTAYQLRQKSLYTISLLETKMTKDIYDSLTEQKFEYYDKIIVKDNGELQDKYKKEFFSLLKTHLPYSEDTGSYKGDMFEIPANSVTITTSKPNNNDKTIKILVKMTVHYKAQFVLGEKEVDFIVKDMVVTSNYNFLDIQNENNNSDLGNKNNYFDKGTNEERFDIKGKITVASDPNGKTGNIGLRDVDVAIDNYNISTKTDKFGNFELYDLKEGTYTLTISGGSTIARQAEVVVTKDKTNNNVMTLPTIPIVMGDFNHDGYISGIDMAAFGKYNNNPDNYYSFADFNQDGSITGIDVAAYSQVFNKNINYDKLVF